MVRSTVSFTPSRTGTRNEVLIGYVLVGWWNLVDVEIALTLSFGTASSSVGAAHWPNASFAFVAKFDLPLVCQWHREWEPPDDYRCNCN